MEPTSTFALRHGVSVSLSLLMESLQIARDRPAAGRFGLSAVRSVGRAAAGAAARGAAEPRVSVVVEADDLSLVERALRQAGRDSRVRWVPLSERMVSVQAVPSDLLPVLQLSARRACRTYLKKLKKPSLDKAALDCGLTRRPSGRRLVPEDGTGVVVGIVDTGFDLSHPMFRDATGALRVEALLDQPEKGRPRTHSRAQLERAWRGRRGPGHDENGHGTHVATIAAGSAFAGLEGVAPGATFLLVKTNFVDTDEAVQWIFRRAGRRPCVVNLSLGHHWGAHDGSDAEERLHTELTSRPGRVICVAAGNERKDRIHAGGRFDPRQSQTLRFDAGEREVPLVFWHARDDVFDLAVVAPDGSVLPLPAAPGRGERFEGNRAKVELGTQRHDRTKLLQRQIQIAFSDSAQARHMNDWQLRITFRQGPFGRIDGWISDDAATFESHALVERARTLGLPATGDGCIVVASHVSRNAWSADDGRQRDRAAVLGRTSAFSSMGPTRDGRWKPDVSAPGQYITAALAAGSESEEDEDRADTSERLLTIEGTSMATPVVAGVVALMLQRQPRLTQAEIVDILRRSARHDANTGPAEWSPEYGFGKVDVARALSLVRP